jgi:AcrR family transcriptional regulator
VTRNIHPLDVQTERPDAVHDPLSPERRRRIIEGAAHIFTRDGYEGASMSQIATAANVSKGTLYNYFPSKQALFAAFVRARCGRLVEDVFGEPAWNQDLEADLFRIGRTMLNVMVSPDGLAMYRVVVMEASKFPELAATFFNAGPKVMVAHMAAWLTRQTTSGALRVTDPQFAAEQFFALTQARVLMRARTDAGYNASQGDIDFVVAGAVQVFLAAYRNTTPG